VHIFSPRFHPTGSLLKLPVTGFFPHENLPTSLIKNTWHFSEFQVSYNSLLLNTWFWVFVSLFPFLLHHSIWSKPRHPSLLLWLGSSLLKHTLLPQRATLTTQSQQGISCLRGYIPASNQNQILEAVTRCSRKLLLCWCPSTRRRGTPALKRRKKKKRGKSIRLWDVKQR